MSGDLRMSVVAPHQRCMGGGVHGLRHASTAMWGPSAQMPDPDVERVNNLMKLKQRRPVEGPSVSVAVAKGISAHDR